MSLKRGPCLWTPIPQSGPAPCDRYKHSCCAHGDSVYLLGGRGKSLLNDFWRYNVVRNEWTELDCSCENAPEEMEEHSMVNYQGLLYVFGGIIDSGYSGNKTPLWVYDTDKEEWLRWQGKNTYSQKLAPVNRKGHSAVVFESSMYMYGGYIDMKGSSHEFWSHWGVVQTLGPGPDPGGPRGPGTDTRPRRTWTACTCSGLTGLREQSDLWRWSFSTHSWSSIRSHSGPSKLVGHSAVAYQDNMLLFGGGGAQSSPPTASGASGRAHAPGEGLSGPRHAGARLRPFKNRCFPAEGSIELDTFCVESRAAGAESRARPPAPGGTCLTFENQEAFGKGWTDVDESSTEDLSFPLPDLLLVLGGRPMGANPGISMWQLTLTDL
ncbi:hypothetical protein ANANG_G00066840 [Anguilla anguilla]|uniref:Uncharacterized protein n=1 Tax=Anguilla anguilla TaxID=7936 RepID=A0A9D3MRS9_ANGAN|nr:hypothetical protein ANANG_G00066840 [Anguilla anguilla]